MDNPDAVLAGFVPVGDHVRILSRLRPGGDGVSDALKRHHLTDSTETNRLLRHAKNDAALFILGDGMRAEEWRVAMGHSRAG